MSATKRVKSGSVGRLRPSGKFRVPRMLSEWMDKYVIRREWTGRPRSLVIVGDPMVGKSAFAESEGNPIIMNSGWCLNSVFDGATHIVVSDVKPTAFGYAGKSYWRDVLGGQERFNCRDFQQETRTLEWGLPCIWTCNFDNDPRKDRAVADYLRSVGLVFEVRDRPGEKSWGKLFVPEEDVGSEFDNKEWREAIAEAKEFMNETDEAVDVGDDFGI
ncbi:MAG: hypothetical protein M1812_005800 [Candelaria pacifica]|nr:MAG: hypothetical protein M1812_005800 [Candelaria pacifica]